MKKRVAVIGAGWAGCAAAVQAVQDGHAVTLIEAAGQSGGRARGVAGPDGSVLDNGQHILIGAYTACLQLMRTVGVDPDAVLERFALDLRTPDGHGLCMPPSSRLPSWDVLRAVAGAKGWSWRDKGSLLLTAASWQMRGFRCSAQASVADVCRGLTPAVAEGLIRPLCISAFNSLPAQTAGEAFLRVLHDALFARRGGSEVLLARYPLAAVMTTPALEWLQLQGATYVAGSRITAMGQTPDRTWTLESASPARFPAPPGGYDHVVLACPAAEAARLVAGWADRHSGQPAAHALRTWGAQAASLRHAPIATTYAWCPASQCDTLPPMQALPDNAHQPAQFVFHHRWHARTLQGQEHHLLALVASNCTMDRAGARQAMLEQARTQLALDHLIPITTIIEKRATFVCHAGIQRPAAVIMPGLSACGDYVQGPYPATLEGAVRSGLAAVEAI